MNILVSACLLGVECRYNGKGVLDPQVKALMEEHHLIPVCPEVFGGLPTPRIPSERAGDRVINQEGKDVTAPYGKGAVETVKLAELYGCSFALMKERSPACGSGEIYDGTFQRRLTAGDGICSELLKKAGVRVYGESMVGAMRKEIERLTVNGEETGNDT